MITKTLISNHNNKQITKQTTTLLETVLKQDYLSFQGNLYQPTKGVSMGSSISGIMAEIFLQHLENSQLKQIIDTNNIIFYTRYVDDLLIIYDTKKIFTETILDHINCIHTVLKFTPTHEHNNTINFLDLTIIKHPSKIEIYCKPTTTDTTINFTSNHPTVHKMAVYLYTINRMRTLPLTAERRNNEWQKILTTADNNQYPLHLITKLKAQTQQKQQEPKTKEKSKKWATITYHSAKVRTITNLLKTQTSR
jgi:hypothetical protein